MKPAISVIVPVYKVEPYLPKCLDSICNQTFRDMEIILVDDGSPDNCGKICDEYMEKDPRIRVIHKENGGLSSARNAGISIAQAELIGFVDSDDWIEPDMFEFLYTNLIQEDADISVCGIYEHKGNNISLMCDDSLHESATGQDAVENYLKLTFTGNASVNKLYRRSLFSDILFPQGRTWEDSFIMVRLIDAARKVVYHTQPKYHYLRRDDSLSAKNYRPELRDCVESHMFIHQYISEKYPTLAHYSEQSCLWAHFFLLDAMMLHSGAVDREDKKKTIAYLRKNMNKILCNSTYTKARKLALLTLMIHPSLYKTLLRLQNR